MDERAGAVSARVRALVVDDEQALVRLVTTYLEREGFQVQAAGDGERAVQLARTFQPEVIVLDLMLPRLDGIEACRQIRTFSDAYVVMLTARAEEVDKLVGLGVGADDYLTKPFSPRELVIDPAAREVRLGGRLVELTRLEFDLLEALSERPRVVLSRRQLLERVWDPGWVGDDHVVDVHIANLRRKLGDDPRAPRWILTVRGVGYRMGAGA